MGNLKKKSTKIGIQNLDRNHDEKTCKKSTNCSSIKKNTVITLLIHNNHLEIRDIKTGKFQEQRGDSDR